MKISGPKATARLKAKGIFEIALVLAAKPTFSASDLASLDRYNRSATIRALQGIDFIRPVGQENRATLWEPTDEFRSFAEGVRLRE